MNRFLMSAIKMIARHGIDMQYKSITKGAYNPETGTPAVTATIYTLRMYPKQEQATQYNFPDLVGKEVITFYLAHFTGFTPKVQDEITYKTKVYRVQALDEHFASGELCLYRLTAVRA